MFARFWSSFENGLRAYCLRVGESKLLPFALKIAYFGGFTFALALACMTLLIPTNSGTARLFLLFGGLVLGGGNLRDRRRGFGSVGKATSPGLIRSPLFRPSL